MNFWKFLIAILPIPPLLGVIIDKYLLTKTEKGRLYDWLFEKWIKIDNSNINTLYINAIKIFLKNTDRLIGDKVLSIKYILSSILISIALTSAAIILGKIVNNTLTGNINLELSRIHMYLGIFMLNYIFDLLTIFITILLLKHVLEINSIWHAPVIFFDMLMGVLFAGCVISFTMLSRGLLGFDHLPDDLTRFMLYSPMRLIENLHLNSYKYLFISLTTVVPTGLYLLVIFILYVLKIITSLIHRTLYVMLDENSEHAVPVFTTLGAFIGFIGLSLSAVVKLLEL